MGNTEGLTFSDAKVVNLMYKCNAHCPAQPECKAPCYVNHKCECECEKTPCENFLAKAEHQNQNAIGTDRNMVSLVVVERKQVVVVAVKLVVVVMEAQLAQTAKTTTIIAPLGRVKGNVKTVVVT